LSDRGIHLEQAHQRQSRTNCNFGLKVVIGQDDNGGDIVIIIGSKCPKCRFTVRGINHAIGAHHKGTVTRHTRH
jgi:hypothetical protein